MRYRKIVLTTALTGLVALSFAAPSQAGLTTLCDGVASDVNVPGDLVIQADKSCELTNVTISGNVTVRADANLLLDASTVNGNVRVLDNGFVEAVDTEIAGGARLVTAYGAYAEGSSLGGNVVADNSGFFYSVGSTHARDITSISGETFLENGWVTRNLTTSGDALTDVYDTVIEGNVAVSDAEQGSVFCTSEVDGDASFTGNADILQIGASAPLTGCGFNVFAGNLSVTDNTAESYISDNVIRGQLVCADNDPLPTVSGNRVRGNENCEADAAMSIMSSRRMVDAEVRKDEVKQDIEARSEVGEEAAEAAGPAFD